MFRGPSGVAIGVSGLAQTHNLQPRGQVPSVVVKQAGPVETGPWTSQQSCPTLHQACPQQTVPGGPSSAVHKSALHWPFWQMGALLGQIFPHCPQL